MNGDVDAVHAATLIDLRWAPRSTRTIDSAIARLAAADPLIDRRAPLLSDLAAAHLLRFGERREGRTLARAIEAAERARELEPDYLPARYNLVLALDALGLLDQAVAEGRAYLARDPGSVWARAVRRLVERAVEPRARAEPTVATPPAAVVAFARHDHERARQVGWDVALAGWSERAARGDARGAEEHLRLAERLGSALVADGGDGTLADEARAIRARAGRRVAYTAAVAAHGNYAEGRRAYRAAAFERAEQAFAHALAVPDLAPPIEGWARVFRGSSLVNAGRIEEGEQLLRGVIAVGDTIGHAGLIGRAHLSLSTALLRSGRDGAALAALRTAERLLTRSGERESVGAAEAQLLESAFLRGDADEGYAMSVRTLTTLRAHRHAAWRHHALALLAREASADGLARAAARCQNEDVAAAAGTGRPFDLVEALLARARLHARTGRWAALDDDLREARRLLPLIPAGNLRAWGGAELALSEGIARLSRRPADAAVRIGESVAFAETTGNVLRLVRALPIRAEAHAAAGAPDAAIADLNRALRLLDVRAVRMSSTFERAGFYRQARRVLDRIVLLRLARGQGGAALVELDRIRWIVSARGRSAEVASPHPTPTFGDETALVYTRVADTLVVWTVADTAVRVSRLRIDGARLDRLIAKSRAALELRSPEGVVRPMLAELFGLLVGPVSDRLGPPGRPLVIVADGELAAVPFAGLYDEQRGRYLIEDRELRFSASLREARRALAERPRGRAAGAFIIADPAFDPPVHPALSRLQGATEEAVAIGQLYPDHTTLLGNAAGRAAVTAALQRATIVHYAGHAVFDEDRPERSYLVLAGGEAEHLPATEIAMLPLRNVRLVALSACQTVGAQRDAVGGLAGLAGAFRAAGVAGVVGSTWRVDDALTRPLMVAFHRAYAVSGDGPGALREAQLRLLRSPTASHRTPAAWASFRYVGS